MFLGRFTCLIDERNKRIQVPAKFRKKLEKLGRRVVMVKDPSGCLTIYPYTLFAKEERWTLINEVKMVEVRIDDFGRIKIPENFREYAGLRRNVVFVGRGEYIEIWDKKRWKAEISRLEKKRKYKDKVEDLL